MTSTPIEIPARQRLQSSSRESPLVFDMSPFYSSYSDRRRHWTHSQRVQYPPESYYYPFPNIGSAESSSRSRTRHNTTLNTPASPHSHLPERVITRGRQPTRSVAGPSASSSRTSSTSSTSSSSLNTSEGGPIRLTPNTTITGFAPKKPSVVKTPKQRTPKRGKLSPSPRRPDTYPSSPWILSGRSSSFTGRNDRRGSTSTTKSTASTDSTAHGDGMTDFKKFMLQRIERERMCGSMRSLKTFTAP